MGDILYTYKNQVYANITNRCDCNCKFCIRSKKDAIGEADNLWLGYEPSIEEIKKEIDAFGLEAYEELVFCGYGEPTCALDTLIETAAYIKSKYGLKIRLNTNGLANLYHKTNVVPKLAEVIDSVSISLNAPTAEKYQDITQPQFENAFSGLLEFAKLAKEAFSYTQLSIVDVLSQEDTAACKKIADEIGVYLRIREYSTND